VAWSGVQLMLDLTSAKMRVRLGTRRVSTAISTIWPVLPFFDLRPAGHQLKNVHGS